MDSTNHTRKMGCCCSSAEDDVHQRAPAVPSSSSSSRSPFSGTGQTLGGGGIDSTSGIEARNAAAAAAFERETNAAGATDRDRKLAERRQKDALVGKICAYYSQMNKDPPIGLSASSVEQLRKHLDHVKREAGGGRKIIS